MYSFTDNPVAYKAIVFAVMGAIIVMIKQLSHRKDVRKKIKKHQNTKQDSFTEPEKKSFRSPSEMRKSGLRHEALEAVRHLMKETYHEVFLQYGPDMEKLVLDMAFELDGMRKDFVKKLYEQCLKNAYAKDPMMLQYINESKKEIKRVRYDENKLGACFLMLLSSYTGKKVKAEDLSEARKIDTNIFIQFKMYFYSSIKKACSKLEDKRIKICAIHYWHAVICMEIHDDEYTINELYRDEYINEAQRDALLAQYEWLKGEKEIFKVKIEEYLNGKDIMVPDEDDAALEQLLEQANVFMLEEKLQ